MLNANQALEVVYVFVGKFDFNCLPLLLLLLLLFCYVRKLQSFFKNCHTFNGLMNIYIEIYINI